MVAADDPVSRMCAEMGLPPPKALMHAARTALAEKPAPAQRPAWPPGFVSKLDALLQAEGRKTAAGSASERSRKASEARQQAADSGEEWATGTALNTAATQAVLRAAKPRAMRKLPAVVRPAAAATVYEWRGHSVGYRVWCLLSDRGPMHEPKLLELLNLPGAKLLDLLAKPMRAGVLAADRGIDKKRLWSIGAMPAKAPATSTSRLGERRERVAE